MLELGSRINHSKFGEGEIIFIEEGKDRLGHKVTYLDVHFDDDEKYQVRTFTDESIKPFLMED